jgi:hypothetical protein
MRIVELEGEDGQLRRAQFQMNITLTTMQTRLRNLGLYDQN